MGLQEGRLQAVLLVASFLVACSWASLVEQVDPHIGTYGHGYGIGALPVGAQVPFGLTRLSPDTSQGLEIWIAWEHMGGYYYGDSHIRMFSHLHTVGAGAMDYGTLGLFPMPDVPTSVGTGYADRYPWMARFSHDSETAEPGYYTALLSPHEPEKQIQAELTATVDVGVHRYTWKHHGQDRVVLIDSSYVLKWDGCSDSSVSINTANGTQEVSGYVHEMGSLSGRFGGLQVYFSVVFNEEFTSWGSMGGDGQFVTGGTSESGNLTAAYVQFPSSVDIVEAYVGISFISVEHARQNREHDLGETKQRVSRLDDMELTESLFDTVKAAAQDHWEEELALVQVNDAGAMSAANMTVFYTSLYHTFMAPTRFSESGGEYLGFDLQVHNVSEGHQYYTDMSIWDTFRTQFPWLALVQRDVMSDVAQSLVLMYEQGGDLPRWPMANGYTNTMVGTHADIVLADCMAHELDFDLETAYAGMYQGATQSQANAGRNDIEDWLTLGYIPVDADEEGCTLTLDYSYDDWAVSLVAKQLGKEDDYDTFSARGKNYQSQWNSTYQFFCPVTSAGEQECPKLFHWFGDQWVEGNAWQYRYYVPHDVPGLVGLFNSTDFFVSQLQEFLEESFNVKGPILPNPWYWGGNEPGLFTLFEFAYVNRPDLLQEYSRRVVSRLFPDEPNGIPGNDDYGAMSAWALYNYLGYVAQAWRWAGYLFFGRGYVRTGYCLQEREIEAGPRRTEHRWTQADIDSLFPRAGDGTYVLGAPMLGDVTLKRANGEDISIVAHNTAQENCYVVNATLNGVVLDSPILTIDQILHGASLEFWMSDQPNDFWM